MVAITYKLEVFEGPLDLLLFLISKNKLNIDDVSLYEVIEQYLSYIKAAQQENADIESEFLEMAARLVYLKTVSLLPKHDEAQQLSEELTGELLEYRLCREMAKKLSLMTDGFNRFVREPTEIDPDKRYRLSHPASKLYDAYFAAVGRGMRKLPPSDAPFQKIVARKIVSVPSRIIHVLRELKRRGTEKFSKLFEDSDSRSQIVATFLAVLELVKANRLHVNGQGGESTVSVIDKKRREK